MLPVCCVLAWASLCDCTEICSLRAQKQPGPPRTPFTPWLSALSWGIPKGIPDVTYADEGSTWGICGLPVYQHGHADIPAESVTKELLATDLLFHTFSVISHKIPLSISLLFIFLTIFFLFMVDFVIHWNETAKGLHVFPIPIPPPTSLSTHSL